jgi:hypothetical protein
MARINIKQSLKIKWQVREMASTINALKVPFIQYFSGRKQKKVL